MAERDANLPQLDFPQLTADLIRELRLTGTLGLLGMGDLVVPTFIIGSRGGALAVTAEAPVFTSAQIFDGSVNAPAVNTVIVDSLALPAGDYDVFGSITLGGNAPVTNATLELQHRDAANAATLAVLLNIGGSVAGTAVNEVPTLSLPLIGYRIGLNERLRVQLVDDGTASGRCAGVIGVRIRPTP